MTRRTPAVSSRRRPTPDYLSARDLVEQYGIAPRRAKTIMANLDRAGLTFRPAHSRMVLVDRAVFEGQRAAS